MAVVAWFAVVFQLVLVLQGSAVLVEDDPPGHGERIYRFFAYFTIQSNLVVAVVSTALAREPALDRPRWRVVRLAGLVGITVTGLVHFFLLRPLLDLDGADWVADKLLHMVVPVLALAAWAWAGPRPRFTVARGGVRPRLAAGVAGVDARRWARSTGGCPTRSSTPDEEGWGSVAVVSVGDHGALPRCSSRCSRWLDRRLPPAPR